MKITQAASCRIVYFFKFIVIFLCSFTLSFSLLSQPIYTGTEKISVLDTFHSRNSFISYVLIDGHPYIFKQKKDVTKQFSVVRDAFAAYIAHDLCIAHSVEIVSSKKVFLEKYMQ